jgi:hypothetical protein
MKRQLGALAVGHAWFWVLLAVLLLVPAQASASALTDCLAKQEVCVAGDGRSLISQAQQAKLERQIGGDPIYLVVAPSGPSGYNSSMNEIIATLSGHDRFTVGFLDTRLRHFGAHNSGMLPAHGAAGIATRVVQQHQADQDVFAALTAFVTDVKQHAEPGSGGAAVAPASHTLRNVLITLGIIAVIASLGFFVIGRPIRKRRERELSDAKAAAQDDLLALSDRLTDRDADVSVSNQDNRDAAEEQRSALAAYERGTTALDAATRVKDMGAVSRAIAEGQYHLACADACAGGRPRPERRPSCFFDPRHGMSVRDVYWTPSSGGAGRTVPACSACAHQADQGIEPEMRNVEVNGAPVSYVNAGFAPAYWGGFGFGPGLFTGFLLGQALAPHAFFAPGGDFGGGDNGGGDF